MINAIISCLFIKGSPYGVLWIQWHHPPLIRTWWPREDLCRRNTHFRPTWSSLLCGINATISCLYIKWSPYGVLWIQRHHPRLMRNWWPREDLSRRNTHFRPNLKFTSIQDKRDNFLSVYQMVPLRGSVNTMAPPSPYADLMAQRRPLQTKHTFSTKLEVHFCAW